MYVLKYDGGNNVTLTRTAIYKFIITNSIVRSKPTRPGMDSGDMKKLAEQKNVRLETGTK